MYRFLELPKSSLFCWFLSVLVLASCSYGSFPIPVVVFQKLHTAHVHKFCSIKISTLIWQSSLEAPGTANTIMICSNYKLNMYICLHSCLCCKLLQLVLVKLERSAMLRPKRAWFWLAKCFRIKSSTTWRDWPSKWALKGCLAQLESNTNICQTLPR